MLNRRGMAFLRTLSKNLLLSLVGVFVTFLLLELALWAYLHHYPGKAAELFLEPRPSAFGLELIASDGRTWITQGNKNDYKFVFHPHLVYKNLPDEHTAEYNINSLGLRGEEVSRTKRPGVFRVIVTGGSAAFGLGATTDYGTWAYQLQQKLNACHSFSGGIEVLNAGVIGYITAQELVYLQLELLDFSPDLVVAFNGYNDFFNPTWETSGCAWPIPEEFNLDDSTVFGEIWDKLQDHALERELTISQQIWSLLVSVATKTYTGKFFYKRLELLKRPAAETAFNEKPAKVFPDATESMENNQEPDAECVAAVGDNYKKNLQKMVRLLNGRNIPLIIALQPELLFKENLSPTEIEIAESTNLDYPWYTRAALNIYPHMAEAAEAVAADNPTVTFLDLRGIFGNRAEDIFTDECHLNDHGNEIVAQFLSDHICRRHNNYSH